MCVCVYQALDEASCDGCSEGNFLVRIGLLIFVIDDFFEAILE